MKTVDEYIFNIVVSKKKLNPEDSKEVFLHALKDFFQNEIDVQRLATIATQLYYVLLKPADYYLNSVSHELGKMLDYTSELDYQEEESKKDVKSKIFFEERKKLLKEYLEKNKDLIK